MKNMLVLAGGLFLIWSCTLLGGYLGGVLYRAALAVVR